MGTDKRRKTVTYKHVTFHTKGPKLKTILDSALKKLDEVQARRQSLAPEGEAPIWRLIADFKIETAMTFGVLYQYVPNTNPRLLVDDPKAKTLKVAEFTTPNTDDGKRREPLEGVLYFATFDNHLVFLQSSALRSSHLEQHLVWLLHKAATLEGTNQLMLVDKPPPALAKRLSNNRVKKLQIGGELLPPSLFVNETGEQWVPTTLGTNHEPLALEHKDKTGTMPVARSRMLAVSSQSANAGQTSIFAALKGLLAPDAAAELDKQALAGSNIEYTLSVTYKGKTNTSGQKLMDTLGVALRHSEDVETKITMLDGGSISGHEIKLSGPVILDFYNGEPAQDDVYEALRSWLLTKLSSGEVKAA